MNLRRQKITKIVSCCMLIWLLFAVFHPAALANSAEPPGLTVIVSFPPEDLTVSLRLADGSMTNAVPLQKEQKGWEAYYRFFYHAVTAGVLERPSFEGTALVVNASEKSFECPLPESAFGRYNNLLTLDIAKESVAVGQSFLRSFLLVAMRVALTLLIEGCVFFAFGYRSKASWLAFMIANLLTQGALNILLSGPDIGSYWVFGFAACEILIFIAEAIAFTVLLKEHKKGRAFVYALTANTLSLILGGVLISYLPI